METRDIAKRFFSCLESYAGTVEGKSLLETCGIQNIAVKGSGAFILAESENNIIRAPNDLDLQIIDGETRCFSGKNTKKFLPLFIENALHDSGLQVQLQAPDPSLIMRIKKKVLPKLEMTLTDNKSGTSLPIGITLHDRSLDYQPETPSGRPLTSDENSFLCLPDLFEQLSLKLMALQNPSRHTTKVPTLHAFDILDVEILIQALHERHFSFDEICDHISAMSKPENCPNYHKRETLETLWNLKIGNSTSNLEERIDRQKTITSLQRLYQEVEVSGNYHLPEPEALIDRAYKIAGKQHSKLSEIFGSLEISTTPQPDH